MKKLLFISTICALVILLNGCAQPYRLIKPQKLNYYASTEQDEIGLYYQYDILRKTGNKKFANNERRKDLKLVAIKVINNSNRTINIGNNVAFFNGNKMIYPLDPIATRNELKQSAAAYLFYMLFTPLNMTINGSDPFPIGLFLGPLLTGGNMLSASGANKNLYTELKQNDILYMDIQPGETAYGLVAFHNIDYAPLSIKFIQ